MASLPSLPSEIWSDQILTRVKSLESLGRCRLVSKAWNHTTYDSWFWQLFCKRSGIVSGFLIQSLYHNNFSSIFVSVDNKANQNLKLSILKFLPVPVKIEAVNQGLVFCRSKADCRIPEYFVCKPTTLQWETLPNPKTRYFTKASAMVVMSSIPLRYKIIRFSEPKVPVESYKNVNELYDILRCEVFDSNTWAWKQLKDVSLPFCVFLDFYHVTACGAWYWLLTNNRIFAFYYGDNTESWEIFDLPQPVSDRECFNHNQLVEYQGRLALINHREGGLWVMEDHEKKVWSKRRRLKVEGSIFPPRAFYTSDIALQKEDHKVIFQKFHNSSCNVVRLEDEPRNIFKLQSDFERVNLRGPWRWPDFTFIFFAFGLVLFWHLLGFVLGF